jgi:hypothetical protein
MGFRGGHKGNLWKFIKNKKINSPRRPSFLIDAPFPNFLFQNLPYSKNLNIQNSINLNIPLSTARHRWPFTP